MIRKRISVVIFGGIFILRYLRFSLCENAVMNIFLFSVFLDVSNLNV